MAKMIRDLSRDSARILMVKKSGDNARLLGEVLGVISDCCSRKIIKASEKEMLKEQLEESKPLDALILNKMPEDARNVVNEYLKIMTRQMNPSAQLLTRESLSTFEKIIESQPSRSETCLLKRALSALDDDGGRLKRSAYFSLLESYERCDLVIGTDLLSLLSETTKSSVENDLEMWSNICVINKNETLRPFYQKLKGHTFELEDHEYASALVNALLCLQNGFEEGKFKKSIQLKWLESMEEGISNDEIDKQCVGDEVLAQVLKNFAPKRFPPKHSSTTAHVDAVSEGGGGSSGGAGGSSGGAGGGVGVNGHVDFADEFICDDVFVFHDGANCPIPKNFIDRDRDLKQVQVNGRPHFIAFPPSHGLPEGSVIVLEVLRAALGCKIGQERAKQLENHLYAIRNLLYDFVLPPLQRENLFHPDQRTLDEMLGVRTVMHLTAQSKSGRDDDLLQDLIRRRLGDLELRNLSPSARRRIIFVIITSDSDHAREIQEVNRDFDCVLLHNPDGNLRSTMFNLCRPGWVIGEWTAIVDKAQRHRVLGRVPVLELPLTGPSSPPPPHSVRITRNVQTFYKQFGKSCYFDKAVAGIDSRLGTEVVQSGRTCFIVPTVEERDENGHLVAVDEEIMRKAVIAIRAVVDNMQESSMEAHGVDPHAVYEAINERCFQLRIACIVQGLKDYYKNAKVLLCEYPAAWTPKMLLNKLQATALGRDVTFDYRVPNPSPEDQEGCAPGRTRTRLTLFHLGSKIILAKRCRCLGLCDTQVIFTSVATNPPSVSIYFVYCKSADGENDPDRTIVPFIPTSETRDFQNKFEALMFQQAKSHLLAQLGKENVEIMSDHKSVTIAGLCRAVQVAQNKLTLFFRTVTITDIPIDGAIPHVGLKSTQSCLRRGLKKLAKTLVADYHGDDATSGGGGGGGGGDDDDDDASVVRDRDMDDSFFDIVVDETVSGTQTNSAQTRVSVVHAYGLGLDEVSRAKAESAVVELVADTRTKIKELVDDYKEDRVNINTIRTGINSSSISNKLYKDFLLFGCFKTTKGPPSIFLAGKSASVDAAREYLTRIPEDRQIVTVAIGSPDIGLAPLLKLKCYKSDVDRLGAQLSSAQVKVGTFFPGKVKLGKNDLFLIRGARGDVDASTQAAQDFFRRLVESKGIGPQPLLSSLTRQLAPEEERFLRSVEGKNLIQKLAKGANIIVVNSNDDSAHGGRSGGGGRGEGGGAGGGRGDGNGRAGVGSRGQEAKILVQGSIGDTQISVIRANIVSIPCDAIVNAANGTLSHGGGVALAIAKAAGQGLQHEGNQLVDGGARPVPITSAVHTGAYNLQSSIGCKVVIHAVGPQYVTGSQLELDQYKATIKSALDKTLQLLAANVLQDTTISIPLIGALIYGWNEDLAASLLIGAVSEWLASGNNLKHINLVDGNVKHAVALEKAVRTFDPIVSKSPSPRVVATTARPRFAWYWQQHESRSWVMYDFDQVRLLEAARVDDSFPVVVRHGRKVYEVGKGACKSRYERQSKTRARLVYEYYQMNVESNYSRPVKFEPFLEGMTMHGFDEDMAQIASTPPVDNVPALPIVVFDDDQQAPTFSSQSFSSSLLSSVSSLSSSSSLPPPAGFVVYGEDGFIRSMRGQLLEVLRTTDKSSDEIDITDLAHDEDGQVEVVLDDLRRMMEAANLDVEIVELRGGKIRIRSLINRELLAAEGAVKKLKDEKTLARLQRIAREIAIQWPQEWEHPPVDGFSVENPAVQYVEVPAGTVEFNAISDRFHNGPTPFPKTITKIERVQNPLAWATYWTSRKLIAARNRDVPKSRPIDERANEKQLFHGTSLMDPGVIGRSIVGLDYQYCQAGMFGKAAYTAEDAAYSHGYRYKVPDQRLAQMFLCYVTAGKIEEIGQPDSRIVRPSDGFDSIRGDVTPPLGSFAIMVYKTDQAYPAYLISYIP